MTTTNLPNVRTLRDDMRSKGWCISVFRFTYNRRNYIVLFEDAKALDIADAFTIAILTFIDTADESRVLEATANTQGINVLPLSSFFEFFGVVPGGNTREYFADIFYPILAKAIPPFFASPADKEQEHFVVNKLSNRDKEPDRNAYICFDARRTGLRRDGSPKTRSIFNDNKTRILYPDLYAKLGMDQTISFFYTSDKVKYKTTTEILLTIANRGY